MAANLHSQWALGLVLSPPVIVRVIGGQSGDYNGPKSVLSKIFLVGVLRTQLISYLLPQAPYYPHSRPIWLPLGVIRDDTARRIATTVCVCVQSCGGMALNPAAKKPEVMGLVCGVV